MKIKNTLNLLTEINQSALTEHKYENVELKRDWAKEHGEKISMLCNGNPDGINYLVIGVEDKGQISGHDETWLKSRLETFSQHLHQFLDPAITCIFVETHLINGGHIIIAGFQNPGVVVKWAGSAWLGQATTKKKLELHEILELSLKLPGLKDFSKFKTTFSADPSLLQYFCVKSGHTFDTGALQRLNLHDKKAGEILFGEAPYRVIKYDKPDIIIENKTRQGLIGCLHEDFFEEIREFYQGKIENDKRITDVLLREALGNSVGHAAYHENSGEIIIELFPTKIQISNLAYKEYIALANKWFSSAHKSPNPFLMETLRAAGKVDELGRGKQRILSECLINGFDAPYITISEAGRFSRWSLVLDFGSDPHKAKKIFSSLQTQYANSEKALIAYALVLWRDKPFSEIAKYFDTHGSKVATEIISDVKGPIWYWEDRDQISLHRWMKVLIEEGKSSKGFNFHEEEQLYKHCRDMHKKFHGGFITAQEFRELAHLSNSSSDQSLTSKTLGAWEKAGRIKKIKRGTYQFIEKDTPIAASDEVRKIIFDAFVKGLSGEDPEGDEE